MPYTKLWAGLLAAGESCMVAENAVLYNIDIDFPMTAIVAALEYTGGEQPYAVGFEMAKIWRPTAGVVDVRRLACWRFPK